MANSLSLYRYSSFALFTLCNAIICCVAVWNLVLAQEISLNLPVDAYLIAISSFGILFIFPALCLDQLRKNALIGRVWFECVWIAVFWLLHFAGAAAVSAILPTLMCNIEIDLLIPGSCTSSRVLLAFTWLNTINLLAYFCLLMVTSILHMKDDSQVWGANVRTYPWYRIRESLNSAGPSPMRTTWSKAPLPSAAPQIKLPSDFGSRMVSSTRKSHDLRSSTMKSAAMKSSALRSSTFGNEKQPTPNPVLSAVPPMLSAVPARTPVTANKSARILQSAWLSATVTPASPPSDESSDYGSGSGSSGSDLTSTPTGLPASAMYVPFSSTIKPSPLGSGPPPRSSSLSATFGQQPMSALLTPSRKGSLRSALPSPKPPTTTTSRPKSKRKSNRPPPLDMTRLHSTYGR